MSWDLDAERDESRLPELQSCHRLPLSILRSSSRKAPMVKLHIGPR